MAGRGENNKTGTSGRGAGRPSRQGLGDVSNPGRSGAVKQTGDGPSERSEKSSQQDPNRDTGLKKENQ